MPDGAQEEGTWLVSPFPCPGARQLLTWQGGSTASCPAGLHAPIATRELPEKLQFSEVCLNAIYPVTYLHKYFILYVVIKITTCYCRCSSFTGTRPHLCV